MQRLRKCHSKRSRGQSATDNSITTASGQYGTAHHHDWRTQPSDLGSAQRSFNFRISEIDRHRRRKHHITAGEDSSNTTNPDSTVPSDGTTTQPADQGLSPGEAAGVAIGTIAGVAALGEAERADPHIA
ncbi:hypothetical protein AAFF_G00376470 [Aldrovandia affinis]|uniref:Uncharacterized protein n=1 Tax=Aldrovandia affinis TaxID=143900 RepID=A0AAD7SHR3_9TELE|nr:hypothetical protein AAFF_G00376470 [Aldrovandia affinis]